MGCGQECLKYLMFIFNFLFFLCGVALLGIGIWVLVDGKSFMQVIGSNTIVFSGVYIIIAVGVALLLISFLGCCGAIKENRCMLGTFFAIVLIIFIVEIVGAILAFVYYPEVKKFVYESMSKYNTNNSTEVKAIDDGWDTMQALFGCCGYDSPENWQNISSLYNGASNGPLVPLSCCVRERFSLDANITNEAACVSMTSDYYKLGCEAKIQQYYWAVGGAGIGVLFVELLAMIFACCLYRGAEKDGDYA